ncbi:MAG: hypothetical protein D6834_01445 [Aquificota bacterium]|nr:MAG: hypothetical protein D6834_01445 [Aquificota bacterium]
MTLIKKISFLFLFSFLLFSCDEKNKFWSLFQEKDLLKHPTAKRCAECHQEIYNQWKSSRHSKSWISEYYKRATNNYSKTKCLSCHSPLEMSISKKPEFRDFHKEDGINCVSCHYFSKDNAIHGPYDVFSPPHPSTEDKHFKQSIMCASCHKETYKQWKETGSSKTCQSCHMTPIKKMKLIQKFPFQYFHFAKNVYNHSFPAKKATKNDLDIKVKKDKDTIELHVTNKGIPHNLPTADNGKPKLYVKIETYKNNSPLESFQKIITPKYSLKYNKEKILEFITFEDFNKVKIKIYRKLSWQKQKELIKELSIKLK